MRCSAGNLFVLGIVGIICCPAFVLSFRQCIVVLDVGGATSVAEPVLADWFRFAHRDTVVKLEVSVMQWNSIATLMNDSKYCGGLKYCKSDSENW